MLSRLAVGDARSALGLDSSPGLTALSVLHSPLILLGEVLVLTVTPVAGTWLADADSSDSDFIRQTDWRLWEQEVSRVGYCANPIHLTGTVEQVDKTTGELRQVYATGDQPTGTLMVRCGSRLASKCPSCAWLYQQDAYHLLKAGLAGGKGVPETIAGHPRVFVTLTAPSFGEIHSRRLDNGQERRCHARDDAAAYCPHGRRLDCRAKHREGDPRIGEPLCGACYRYEDAVLWNHYAPELWRRTIEYVYRALAERLGVPARRARMLVKVEFAKVAEWQARGQIHYHAIVRLDAVTPADDGTPLPPDGLTADDLVWALDQAVSRVPPPDLHAWGAETQFRPIAAERSPSGPVCDDQVAGYLAKYATKATEAILPSSLGHHDTLADLLDDTAVREHIARLAQAAVQLGALLGMSKLARHAKTLGFGGHFLTKSRRYSTTFTALRRVRMTRRQPVLDAWDRPIDPARVEIVSTFAYQYSGYRTVQERELAIASAVRAREHRRQRWAAQLVTA